jgi:CRISPR system Cascade subunit CasC
MKLIELHIIHSFPPTCLNRDDLGSPKSAAFGGSERARVSSQCWKRPIRFNAATELPEFFQGQRTRLIIGPLVDRLKAAGIDETDAEKIVKPFAHELAELDKKAEKKGTKRVKTAVFFSRMEMDAIGAVLLDAVNAGTTDGKALLKAASQALKKAKPTDAAEIGLFGRMVASDQSLTIEGASMFNHAISTHKAMPEIDFFAAVDDRQPRDESGAAITAHQEFNSAVYYRYIALNADLLEKNIPAFSCQQLRSVTDAFIRSVLESVPVARRNSMNGHTRPSYVLGIVRRGSPTSLANAFEKPISSKDGIVEPSIAALEAHYAEQKRVWGIKYDVESIIPKVDLNTFCETLLDKVFPK